MTLLFLSSPLVFSKPVYAWPPRVYGQVVTSSTNAPISGATVIWTRNDGGQRPMQADGNGNFSYEPTDGWGCGENPHVFTASVPGENCSSTTINLNNVNSETNVGPIICTPPGPTPTPTNTPTPTITPSPTPTPTPTNTPTPTPFWTCGTGGGGCPTATPVGQAPQAQTDEPTPRPDWNATPTLPFPVTVDEPDWFGIKLGKLTPNP